LWEVKVRLPTVFHIEPHFIGDQYHGGIVFWVEQGGQHGLIAAMRDQTDPDGRAWFNSVSRFTGTSGDGIGAGAMNTAMIVATQIADAPSAMFAARLAANYSVNQFGDICYSVPQFFDTCYGDWYLPSRVELNLLFSQQGIVGNFQPIPYWSSTEVDGFNAYAQSFTGGGVGISQGKSNLYAVRAISSF
jgi:hypothetical protein